ncbi:CPBP family intramembrane glutamic endopeptidase [Oenococcus oeni]|uniref:CPBP family intramembrane glutamic endopeptidase n=1 Tax=Oenococcus oeni TaxID=1247 RepID=UPI0010B6EFF8|nr:CPBP family intramembrane glutamic endopeptidase [Oenococcus oeni]SYW08382.1 putative metal-dependent membrane protease [Oenococcus oeni]
MLRVKQTYIQQLKRINHIKGIAGLVTSSIIILIAYGLEGLAIVFGYGYGSSTDTSQAILKFACFLLAVCLIYLLINPFNHVQSLETIKNWKANLLVYLSFLVFAYLTIRPETLTIYDFNWENIFDCLTIGVVEEGIFRLLIFNWFLSKYPQNFVGALLAALISSFWFALMHLFNLITQAGNLYYVIGQTLSAFFFGFICATIYYYSKAIWIPIVFHALNDFVAFSSNPSLYIASIKELDTALTNTVPDFVVALLLGSCFIYQALKQRKFIKTKTD